MAQRSHLAAAVLGGMLFMGSLATAQPQLVTALKVLVTNTSADPVPVREVGAPARALFQMSYGGSLNEGEANGCVALFDIPVGRRLIVEHVTLHAFARPDQEVVFSLSITNGDNSQYARHTISAHRLPGGSQYVASDPLKAYGGPGSQACLSAQRNIGPTDGQVTASLTISGYTIAAP